MRRLIALLPILIIVAACDRGVSGIAVKTSHVIGAEVTTNVELQTDHVGAPDMVKAMAKSVRTVAARLQSGEVKPPADARFAEVHFTATDIGQTRNWDLLTLRIPLDGLRSVPRVADGTADLELADVLTPGKGPDALKAASSYCQGHSAANPKFCGLVAFQGEGED